MQKNSTKSIKTFSIGFDNPLFNEAEHAKAIASYLGTDHFESYVTGTDALNVVEKLVDIYDEPFADSSQIPMYLLSKETRKHVTVSLSGDAGDELFGGYSRYINTIQKWNKINNIPLGSFFLNFHLFYLII
jgi:asparagine synthase (glutamine-hydrolysing)